MPDIQAPVETPIYDENGIMSDVWWVFLTDLGVDANAARSHASSDGTDHSDVALNNTHRASDGTDHSFINQDVTTSASPRFNDVYVKKDRKLYFGDT